MKNKMKSVASGKNWWRNFNALILAVLSGNAPTHWDLFWEYGLPFTIFNRSLGWHRLLWLEWPDCSWSVHSLFFMTAGMVPFSRTRRQMMPSDFSLSGMLTFTPYHHWKWEHAVHHATNGDLDKRGIGDVWTMTVEEYITSSRWIKLSYRLLRNPFILFGLAPLFLFFVLERIPSSKCKPRERRSVYLMNITLLLYGTAMSMIFGLVPFLILQTVMMGVAGGCGIWLFYVQHQFEDTYWAQGKDWDFTAAAMEGSSYYKLPRIMQWFSGNIGFHHIHHLNPMIPNYHLEKCHHSDPFFQVAPELNLLSSLKNDQIPSLGRSKRKDDQLQETSSSSLPASS